MGPIDEQTIFITGATSGPALELAQALAKQSRYGPSAWERPETVRKIKEATGTPILRAGHNRQHRLSISVKTPRLFLDS
jgi:NADP-dependent 3-hydroxy acid dehydrogenase YdfG